MNCLCCCFIFIRSYVPPARLWYSREQWLNGTQAGTPCGRPQSSQSLLCPSPHTGQLNYEQQDHGRGCVATFTRNPMFQTGTSIPGDGSMWIMSRSTGETCPVVRIPTLGENQSCSFTSALCGRCSPLGYTECRGISKEEGPITLTNFSIIIRSDSTDRVHLVKTHQSA